MSLARRRNRYSYLIKLSGACSLASALTCALVTVTTTVIHMSRLQALRECQYTQKTRTCTCSSALSEMSGDDMDDGVGVRFVFDATADCSVVHGALYSCLRAVFGLSVAGVFVAVFSCMLVYQLLSHERKKMYWEQLELRCRSLYSGAPPMPPPGPAIIGTPRGATCRCCEQCHAHRGAIPSSFPWDGDSRFWAGQGGNFYSPNPGGDEGNRMGTSRSGQRNRSWNWPRMPWQRHEPSPTTTQTQPPPSQRFRGPISSSDSQYGFSNGTTNIADASSSSPQHGYSVIGGPYGVWGPPPPYSDPNSPARRGGRYQYVHPNPCHPMLDQHIPPNQPPILECHQHNLSTTESHSEQFCPQSSGHQQARNLIKRQAQFKSKENYENAPSDSDGGRFSNTLPVRKTKKRVDVATNKSIGSNQPQQRVNVQNVFNNLQTESNNQSEASENEYNEPTDPSTEPTSANPTPQHARNRRIKLGIENTGFQPIENADRVELINGNAESEVYFADVSSCCNISVKNDNYYEDANQRLTKEGKTDADDYLSQRFGKKESSIRSRLPFPQNISEDFQEKSSKSIVPAPRTSMISKEISRQSMCSIDSGEKTDFTDLSPATPTVNFQPYPSKAIDNYNHQQDNFVATFPYNETSQEAHRRATKNLHDIFISNDAQYETIKDSNQFETTPLTLNYELNHDISSSSISSSSYSNNKSSPIHYSNNGTPTNNKTKNVNASPSKRQNLGTNISAIIQNLSSDLYPESNSNTQSPQHKYKQDCNNDVINSNIV
ncbi:CLUMA_CG009790, isoform A, partial [Clunio marinus]